MCIYIFYYYFIAYYHILLCNQKHLLKDLYVDLLSVLGNGPRMKSEPPWSVSVYSLTQLVVELISSCVVYLHK